MDFERRIVVYSPEQEEFRLEVKQWLDENVPPSMKLPPEESASTIYAEDLTPEHIAFSVELRRKLGSKGWLYPTYPNKYGGGGLTRGHRAIIGEELAHKHCPLMYSNDLIIGALLVWGTEEQKQEFLPGIFNGDVVCIQSFTEPQGGSDLANVLCRARKAEGGWLLNGQKIFASGDPHYATYTFGPIMTDPDAPRHRNLGFFIIPAHAPGVTLIPQRLLNGWNQNFLMLDDVRVPDNYLIGGDHDGWKVTQTVLEQEHGGAPGETSSGKSGELEYITDFARVRQRAGESLGADLSLQERIAQIAIESRIRSLLAARNYSMYAGRQEMSYHGAQVSFYRKLAGVRQADAVRDLMGPYALLGNKDPLAPYSGRPERRQRTSLVDLHPGGTYDVQKVIMARRLGLSRTIERAAPTAGPVES